MERTRYWQDEPGHEDYIDVTDRVERLTATYYRMQQALELIAAPRRPDGTYNRSREACEELAREVLERDELSAAPH